MNPSRQAVSPKEAPARADTAFFRGRVWIRSGSGRGGRQAPKFGCAYRPVHPQVCDIARQPTQHVENLPRRCVSPDDSRNISKT